MSTDTERVDAESEREFSVVDAAARWYHVPVIGFLMAFMLAARLRPYERVTMSDGEPRLAAVDSWYHWRTVEWTAENYPYTMPYEIYTSFPDGRYVGQFGTLFDQIIVTAAMIIGLGSPSTELLYTVAIVAVPVMAALVAIPVYLMGKRLGGRSGGLVAVVLLALAPGEFLIRSTAGQLQHHVAEVLFMATAVLAMMMALRVAEREKPVWELVVDRDLEGLKQPALWSALAGVALTLYIWVWPPGVVLIGIFGVFFAIHLCLDYVRGVSPDHVAFVGAISLGLTALFTLILVEEPGTSVTSFGYLQPATAFLVAAGCLFMAWFARQWNDFDVERVYYPGAIGGLLVLTFVAMALALPDFFSTLVGNVQGRVIPFGERGSGLTIAEAQPPDNFADHMFNQVGAAFYTMLVGIALLLARPFLNREFRAEHTLMIVWALFLTSMAATQIRFAYYIVLPVAVLNAVVVGELVGLFDVDLAQGIDAVRQIETYQIIVIVVVVMLLFMPLLPPIAADDNAWERGAGGGPSGDAMVWADSTDWMQEGTPEPGNWAGAGHQDDLEYFGVYEYPADGSYDYPDGAYGVMSWWDYGHLITTQSERMPHSNPFQSNARSSSWYLTAQGEAHGEAILDGIAAGIDVEDRSLEDLEADLEETEPGHEEMRYVMIDDQMAGGKFSAITDWTGPDYQTYLEEDEFEFGGGEERLPTGNDQYRNTMLASLYLDDAEGMEHYRLVHENDEYSVVGGMAPPGLGAQPHYSLRLGQQLGIPHDGYDENVAQLDGMLTEANANEQVSQQLGLPIWDGEIVSAVKTFERVEGATIEGTVEGEVADGETVYAQVELETEPGRTFVYTQQAEVEDGSFEMTVPYATTEDVGAEDGYTDTEVEALDDYAVFVGSADDGEIEREFIGTTEVSETAVIEGETTAVTLEPGDGEVVPDPDAEPQPAAPEEADEEDESDEEETEEDDSTDAMNPLAPPALSVAG